MKGGSFSVIVDQTGKEDNWLSSSAKAQDGCLKEERIELTFYQELGLPGLLVIWLYTVAPVRASVANFWDER